jgi:hypothetical protein
VLAVLNDLVSSKDSESNLKVLQRLSEFQHVFGTECSAVRATSDNKDKLKTKGKPPLYI